MVRPTREPSDSVTGNTTPGAHQLADWLHASVVDLDDVRPLRLAFMGRTSDDEVQDPTISIPRQLRSARSVLSPGMEISFFFWDVETSRLELDARGSSTAWKKFAIDVPRDGGIADLLREAGRPDRRFDGVICESIDRIGRFSYQSTKIEHDLEQMGLVLIAADEPIVRSSRTGQIERNAALTLLRRTKQGVAEWYVLEMLEKSRNGIEIHTDQGFNVGKPCYGYQAERVRHPVPAKRSQGKHKTRLEPDPTRSATVAKIFDLRVNGALSYRAICGVLNEDLDVWPPPQPVDPTRAVGHWSPGAVRDILVNPKYTGYMVWNRRATKHKQHPGQQNPKDQWVISSRPQHQALVSVETFLAAQNLVDVRSVHPGREKHRADRDPASPNTHPQTRHVYRLRSYVWCVPCQRRMHGYSTRHGTAYSYCQPRNRVIPDGHPKAVRVREDALIAGATWFFNHHILGPDRAALAQASMPAAADFVRAQYYKTEETIQRKINELSRAMDNLMRVLERTPDPDGLLFARTSTRIGELEREIGSLDARLRKHQAAAPPELDENPGLLA